MKIAIWHNQFSGGAKRALYDQIRGLLARGHEIEAWCPASADLTYLPLSEMIRENVLPLHRPVARTNWDKRLRIPARVEPQLTGMEKHCAACASEISAGDFDILLAHPCVYFAVPPIGRMVDIPSVLYLQEPFRVLYEARPRLPWLGRPKSQHPLLSLERLREEALDHRTVSNARLQAREEVRNAEAFNRILVNSMFSREAILRSYGLDAEVCYLGTDLARFEHQGRPREQMVVGLGSISPPKNLALAIEAVALLPEPRPTLTWIGNAVIGDHLNEMVALARSLDVTFTPRLLIPDNEIVSLLNRATAMIYTPHLEPFGYAAIEAAACGLPVVGVAEGGVRESVIDGVTGFLVRRDAASIAERVGALLADPGLVTRLGLAARANAERNWSLEAAMDRLEAALQRVVENRYPGAMAPMRLRSSVAPSE